MVLLTNTIVPSLVFLWASTSGKLPSWHAVALEFHDVFVRQDFSPDTGKFNRTHRFIGMKMATTQSAFDLTIESKPVRNDRKLLPGLEGLCYPAHVRFVLESYDAFVRQDPRIDIRKSNLIYQFNRNPLATK